MFVATFMMKELGKFPSFKDAFKAIYDAIMDANTPLTSMALETTIWITVSDQASPVMFFDARDRAVEAGWIRNGRWVG